MSPAGVPDQLVAAYGSDGNVTAIFVVSRMSGSIAAVISLHLIVFERDPRASADDGGRVPLRMFYKRKRAAQACGCGARGRVVAAGQQRRLPRFDDPPHRLGDRLPLSGAFGLQLSGSCEDAACGSRPAAGEALDQVEEL